MSAETVKRVSKYDIKNSHELFDYCDTESFKSKNLRNLANYHIRQCFILSQKDETALSKEQIEYLKNINECIGLFNDKKKPLFYEKKPKKVEKARQDLEAFITNTPKKTKKYKENLEKKQDAVSKAVASEYKPHKLIVKIIKSERKEP